MDEATSVGASRPSQTGRGPRGRRRKRRVAVGAELDHVETVSLVCRYLCDGHLPAKIAGLMKADHGIELHREQPYRYIAHAARQGWLHFVAPPAYALRDELLRAHPWLQGVRVAHTASFDDVAHHTALTIVELMRSRARPPFDRNVVHIGFAGGHAMRRVAQNLAGLLRQPGEGLPASVVFHALVAGFDVGDPTTDPNAFFTYFVDDSAMPLQTRFVGLHAPPIIEASQLDDLKKLDGISEAFARREELDIIVTSGGSWQTPCAHSMLRNYMERCPDSMKLLQSAGCLGDMLWRPLSGGGPLTQRTRIRAMTLIELTDLRGFIADGKAVVLMLGPCRKCAAPRPEFLRTILDLRDHLITHLVTDTRSAAGARG